MNYKTEPNYTVVQMFRGVMNFMHVFFIVLVILKNAEYFDPDWEGWESKGHMIFTHTFITLGAILVYLFGVGAVSVLLSIHNNLERLVQFQTGQSSEGDTRESVKWTKPLENESGHSYDVSGGTEIPTTVKIIITLLIISGAIFALIWSVKEMM